MKNLFIYWVILFASLCLLQSCASYQHLYYVSPLNGKNNNYVAMPLMKDSIKIANYAHISFAAGYTSSSYGVTSSTLGVSTDGSYSFDKYFFLETGFYQTRKINNFHTYYGGDFCYGNYVYSITSNTNKTFSTVGLIGGIDYVIKKRSFEWRLVGLEFSSNKEFGNYLDFRKNTYDSLATVLIKNSNYTTLGLSTEIISYTRDGSICAKFSFGGILEKEYNNTKTNDFNSNYKKKDFYYSMVTLSHTKKRVTTYLQMNKGIQTAGIKFGILYRL